MLDLNEQLKDMAERLRPVVGQDVEIVIVTNSDQALVKADPGQIREPAWTLIPSLTASNLFSPQRTLARPWD